MLGKFMNNYYYGKSGKGDYRKEDLPKNRWQLFWEMLRIRFSGLVRLNLMAAIAWIPTIIIIVMLFNALLSTAMTAGDVASIEGTAATETQTQTQTPTADTALPPAEGDAMASEPLLTMDDFMSVFYMSLIFLIPAITITGPSSAGVAYITRNWARDEHAFIWSDFKDAVKANWKQSLLVSFITSLMPFIMYTGWTFYSGMVAQSLFYVVPQMMIITIGILWSLALVFIYPMIVTYQVSFGKLVKNSIMLAIARLPHTVGVRLAMLIPLVIVYFLSMTSAFMYALLGLLLYYILLGYSLSKFVFASYTNGVFDKYINAHIEGAVVNRGLSDEEDDEEEEEGSAETPDKLEGGADDNSTQG